MNRKLMNTLFLMVLMAAVMLSASVARADSLVVTIDPSSLNGLPGTTISFYGTISAPDSNSGALNINAVSLNPSGPMTGLDQCVDGIGDCPFFLNPGDSSSNVLLFNIAIDPHALAYFSYSGTFVLQGGPGGEQNIISNSAPFTVNVVPEPASMLLLGSGLSGLVGVVRRKRQK